MDNSNPTSSIQNIHALEGEKVPAPLTSDKALKDYTIKVVQHMGGKVGIERKVRTIYLDYINAFQGRHRVK